MTRFQFSLLALFGLVTCVALGCAALVSASLIGCAAVYLATLVALLAGIPGIVYRRGPARAFWVGFVAFGCGYVALSGWFYFGGQYPYDSITNTLGSFTAITTPDAVFDQLYTLVKADRPDTHTPDSPGGVPGEDPFSIPTSATARTAYGQQPPDALPRWHFRTTANMLFTLLLSLVGGLLGRGFYGTRERAEEAKPRAEGPPRDA